jgi:hypothetical protein
MRSRRTWSCRAQIPQLFLFLSAVLVIGATLFIGMKLFGWLSDTGCEASDASFIQEMDGIIGEYLSYGSRGRVSIRTSCDAHELCFVDVRDVGDATYDAIDAADPENEARAVLQTKVRNRIPTTIYVLTDDDALERGADTRITLADGARGTPVCIQPVGGKFTFMIEGLGRTVVISRAG